MKISCSIQITLKDNDDTSMKEVKYNIKYHFFYILICIEHESIMFYTN